MGNKSNTWATGAASSFSHCECSAFITNIQTYSRELERPGPPLCSVGKVAFGGNTHCGLCSPVNLALIKYLCFLVELLTLLPQLVSCLPVSDDTGSVLHQYSCPSPCLFCFSPLRLCYLTFPLSALLCQPFCPLSCAP